MADLTVSLHTSSQVLSDKINEMVNKLQTQVDQIWHGMDRRIEEVRGDFHE